jgi:hypothetical protein
LYSVAATNRHALARCAAGTKRTPGWWHGHGPVPDSRRMRYRRAAIHELIVVLAGLDTRLPVTPGVRARPHQPTRTRQGRRGVAVIGPVYRRGSACSRGSPRVPAPAGRGTSHACSASCRDDLRGYSPRDSVNLVLGASVASGQRSGRAGVSAGFRGTSCAASSTGCAPPAPKESPDTGTKKLKPALQSVIRASRRGRPRRWRGVFRRSRCAGALTG